MKYLLDTNIISELVATKPNVKVTNWFNQIPAESFYLSVLTMGEIRKGVEKVTDKTRKNKLLIWLEHELLEMFNSRILPISIEVADYWGRLQGKNKRILPAIDSLIAATALHYDMTLVTRNVGDFSDCLNLEIINPWE